MSDRAAWDITALLNAADAGLSRPVRHLWLVRLTEWLRHDGGEGPRDAARTPLPVLRLRLLLNVLERHDEHRTRVAAMLGVFWRDVDVASLFSDFGFGHRMSLWGELRQRLAVALLPATPDTSRLADLFALLFPHPGDAAWLRAIDDDTLARVVALLRSSTPPAEAGGADGWRQPLADAAMFLAGSISAAGFSAPLRQRMDAGLLAGRPFRQLVPTVAAILDAQRSGHDVAAVQALTLARALLDVCARCNESIAGHLEEHGVSVDIVYETDQLASRIRRLDEILTCLVSPAPARDVVRLLADLSDQAQRRRDIGALFGRHYSMLARQVAERSAEAGSHYITRTRAEYRGMLGAAAGGGAVIAVTTFLKFGIAALGLTAFWTGFWSGINYAASFVVVMLLHWTVATKQPAMTAPALAARLPQDPDDDAQVEAFVDEVTHLIRSQSAGIFGNLALVFPLVLGTQWLALWLIGRPLVAAPAADYVLHSLTLLGPTAFYAAFTGVLLFSSSLIAGWAENAFVFHRVDSALAWNPRIVAALGPARAARWSRWCRTNVSGLAANVSLGMMLGLVPALLGFLGLAIDVRHVTLSTGQLGAALGALGWGLLAEPAFWWCAAGIAVTGLLNVGVSFWLAFKVALRSRGVQWTARSRIARGIRRRLWRRPLSFLVPPAP